MSANCNTLFLLEFPDEALACLDVLLKPSDAQTVISLTPKTLAYLKQRGIEANSSSPYFNTDAHERVLMQSERITNWLRAHFSFEDALGLKSYQSSLVWNIRQTVHHFLWLLEILQSACGRLQASAIAVASPKEPWVGGQLIWPEERYLGLLASRFGNTHQIPVVLMGKQPRLKKVFQKRNREDIQRWSWKKVLPQILNPFYWYWVGRKKSSKVLLATRPHQMGVLSSQLCENGWKPECIKMKNWKWPSWSKSFSSSLKLKQAIWQLADQIQRETELFSSHGVCFADLVCEKLKKGIAPFLFHLHRRAAGLSFVLKKTKPALVLAAGNGEEDGFLGEFCVQNKIPAMMMSHGSFVRPKNESERIEWGEQSLRLIRAPYPYVALQSPLAEDFLSVLHANGKNIKTGPLVWGGPVNRMRSRLLKEELLRIHAGKKVLLYANTPKGRGAHRFFVFETSDEFIQSLQELSQAVLQNNDMVLVIKFRPTYDMNLEDLSALLPHSDRILIDQKSSFSEVLGFADLLVSFSSTTIEEALQNQVPVLLYGGGGRYCHIPNAQEVTEPARLTVSAVHWARHSEDLSWALPLIFEKQKEAVHFEKLFESYCYPEKERISLQQWMKHPEGVTSHV